MLHSVIISFIYAKGNCLLMAAEDLFYSSHFCQRSSGVEQRTHNSKWAILAIFGHF
jgi:hypothetical protein